MVVDYRNWLQSQIRLLASAGHEPYALGQAHMAQRALERFERAVAGRTVVALEQSLTDEILAALELLEERQTSLDPALAALRTDLQSNRSQEDVPS
jgi:hypothetical protein